MSSIDMAYVQLNLHVAERLLIRLEDRRLLRERMGIEDEEYCRRSASQLRQVFEAEMMAVTGKGSLLGALRDMRNASTNFVTAAGPKAKNFERDRELFEYHLEVLREIVGQRVKLIVHEFALQPSDEIREIIRFARH